MVVTPKITKNSVIETQMFFGDVGMSQYRGAQQIEVGSHLH